MSGFTQRVRDSIVPRSVAGTLPAAFEELAFTENTVDHEAPIETCGALWAAGPPVGSGKLLVC